jgi:hypothetical protein
MQIFVSVEIQKAKSLHFIPFFHFHRSGARKAHSLHYFPTHANFITAIFKAYIEIPAESLTTNKFSKNHYSCYKNILQKSNLIPETFTVPDMKFRF